MTCNFSQNEKISRQLDPCPKSPNCVSSLSKSPTSYVEPLKFAISWHDARPVLLTVLERFKRARVIQSEEFYIHAEFKSFLFRFIDDVEFMADETENCIHVRSASRNGYWDLGINRKRVETIRNEFYQLIENKAKDL